MVQCDGRGECAGFPRPLPFMNKEQKDMRKNRVWMLAAMAACAVLACVGCSNDSDSEPGPVAVESVTLDKTTLTLEYNKTEKLTATVMPSNAEKKTVTWETSDYEVAKVGFDGTVTAIKVGKATITAKAGGKQATCEVTVTTVDVPAHTHSYEFNRCTKCGFPKPVLNGGVITDEGKLSSYSGTETAVVIPDGVTSIGSYAFPNSTSLESVTIPASVTSIENDAFTKCTSLKSVTISEGVTSIGDRAFSYCTSLKSVTIPSSVTSIKNSRSINVRALRA